MSTEELLEQAKALPPAEQLAPVKTLLNELDFFSVIGLDFEQQSHRNVHAGEFHCAQAPERFTHGAPRHGA